MDRLRKEIDLCHGNIWEINVLLLTDESLLVTDSKGKVRDLLLEFE